VNEGRSSLVRAWLAYAGAGLVLVAAASAAAMLLLEADAALAVRTTALIAYVLQLVAFGVLLVVRGRNALFMAGWLGGMLLRFGGLAAVAWWVTRTSALPRAAALISLATFLFVLLLLEPFFLRRSLRAT